MESIPEFSGHLFLQAEARADGRTVLAAQSFRAPFHLSKPHWDPDTRTLLVQVVNPTAGILAGDRLESQISVGGKSALVVTTPSASRVFQMRSGEAVSRQSFAVAAGGWLEVMPEPLVPHRGSNYRQITTIDVEPGGSLFYVEQFMPGRVGHGDAWLWDRLRLELSLRLGGELILRERFDQTGAGLRALAELGGSGTAACFANAILLVPLVPQPPGAGKPAWIEQLCALHQNGLWAGVSALRRGSWSLRLIAPDSIKLHDGLRAARAILAQTFPYLSVDLRKL